MGYFQWAYLIISNNPIIFKNDMPKGVFLRFSIIYLYDNWGQKNKPILFSYLVEKIPAYWEEYQYSYAFGSAFGAAGLAEAFGRLLPNEPLVILPRFVLLSPFPIVNYYFISYSRKNLFNKS